MSICIYILCILHIYYVYMYILCIDYIMYILLYIINMYV